MTKFDVGTVIDYSWNFTKKHGLIMVGLLLLLLFVFYLLEIVFGWFISVSAFTTMLPSISVLYRNGVPLHLMFTSIITWIGAMFPLLLAYSLCMQICQTVMAVGYRNTALRLVNGKSEKIDFSGFKLPVMTYVKVFFASMLTSILVSIATILCILPGIFVLVRLMFVNVALIDDPELPFFDAYSKSWEMTKGHFWELLLLGVVTVLINIIGLLCCCVGVLATIVMTEFANN